MDSAGACASLASGTEAGQEDGPDDHVLLQRWSQARDEAAFEALVLRHRAMVEALCRSELDDPRTAEEVVHEVFAALATCGSAIGGTPQEWLRATALGRCLALSRSRRRQGTVAAAAAAAVPDPPLPAEQVHLLDACLADLEAGERRLLVRLYYDGLSQAEVARADAETPLAVHRRHRRALMSLRSGMARRGLRLGMPALVLLLCGGDRLAAAEQAPVGTRSGWWMAAAATVVAAGLLSLALAREHRPAAAPAPMVPEAVEAPPVPASAIPAAPAIGMRGMPLLADGADPAALAAVGAVEDLVAAGLPQVLVAEVAGDALPAGGLLALKATARPIDGHPAAQVVRTGLPPPFCIGWRLAPPSGRTLFLFSAVGARDLPRRRTEVARADGVGGSWSLIRYFQSTAGGRVLNAMEEFPVQDGMMRLSARRWRSYPPAAVTGVADVAVPVRAPAILLGLAVAAIADDDWRRIDDACPGDQGTVTPQ